MDKRTFLKDLRRELERLPFEERENAISYYEEYLHEAGPEKEAETITGFGSPQAVAAQIRVDYAMQGPSKTPKEGFKTVWIVVLAIVAAPFAMPIAIILAVMMFVGFIVMASVVFALGVTGIALVGGGLFYMAASFPLMVSDFPTFLYLLGAGAALVGVGIFLGYGMYVAMTKLAGGFARLLGRILNKMKERRER